MDLAEYRAIFLEEAGEHLEEMSRGLLELERDPARAEALDLVFRMTHSIKGMAMFLGMGVGAYNIWVLPLDGGEAQPLTGFKSGDVLDFDWSPDGKRLFMLRGGRTSDVVRITEVRPARRGTVR